MLTIILTLLKLAKMNVSFRKRNSIVQTVSYGSKVGPPAFFKEKNVLRLLTMLLCLFGMISLTSCNAKEDENLEIPVSNSFDSYLWIGDLHNTFLQNVEDNFNPEVHPFMGTRGDNYNPAEWAPLHSLQLQQATQLDLEAPYKQHFINSLNECQSYYVTSILKNDLFPNNSIDNFEAQLSNLRKAKVIDVFESNLLIDLASAVQHNMDGEWSNRTLFERVMQLVVLWKSQYENKPEGSGQVSAYVLSISMKSMEWWSDNDLVSTRAVPAIIGADVAGALIGAATNALVQYTTTKKINYKTLALTAGANAIIGSTGIVGKVGSWIGKLF